MATPIIFSVIFSSAHNSSERQPLKTDSVGPRFDLARGHDLRTPRGDRLSALGPPICSLVAARSGWPAGQSRRAAPTKPGRQPALRRVSIDSRQLISLRYVGQARMLIAFSLKYCDRSNATYTWAGQFRGIILRSDNISQSGVVLRRANL